MPTTLQTLIDRVRVNLIAPIGTDTFWSDTELLAHLNAGIRDLWRAISDTYQDYFLTIDRTNVYLAPSTNTLTGVPAGVTIVRSIRPRSLSSYPALKFEFRPYDHRDFLAAQTEAAIEPSNARLIYFCITDAGGPVAAPTIRVAPTVTAQILLELAYYPTLTDVAANGNNPVPGESDMALIAFATAFARAREREDRLPDPGWLTVYATEKRNILTFIAPRQTQDETVVEALFEEYW